MYTVRSSSVSLVSVSLSLWWSFGRSIRSFFSTTVVTTTFSSSSLGGSGSTADCDFRFRVRFFLFVGVSQLFWLEIIRGASDSSLSSLRSCFRLLLSSIVVVMVLVVWVYVWWGIRFLKCCLDWFLVVWQDVGWSKVRQPHQTNLWPARKHDTWRASIVPISHVSVTQSTKSMQAPCPKKGHFTRDHVNNIIIIYHIANPSKAAPTAFSVRASR